MTGLHDVLDPYVADGTVPGAVGLVARGDQVEIQAVGSAAVGGAPMAADSIFRLASITKPVTAAAVMMLVEEGRIGLRDPAGTWLPELASPMVVRTPASPVDDLVPAQRPITVLDLLTAGRPAAVQRADRRSGGAAEARSGRVDGAVVAYPAALPAG